MTKSFSAGVALAIILAGLAISPAFAGDRHRGHDNSDRMQRYYGLVEQSPSAPARAHGTRDPFPVYSVDEYSPVTDQ
ncbi:MAG: hypothetical protein AB1508_14435 [Pseudomonadota bacterium]